jgi:hypothetical protein
MPSSIVPTWATVIACPSRRRHAAARAQREVLGALLETPAGNLDVLHLQGPRHLRHGDVVRAQPVRIEPQVDLAAAPAQHQDLPDPADRFEAPAQHLVRVLGDLPDRSGRRDGEAQHRGRVHVHLLDDRLEDVARQQRQDAVDLIAHFLRRHIHVLLEQERRGHNRHAFGRRRSQLVEPADGVDRLFDLVGDLRLDLLRGGPRLPGRDHDRGKVDLRESVDAQLRVAEYPDDRQRENQNRGEHRPPHA